MERVTTRFGVAVSLGVGLILVVLSALGVSGLEPPRAYAAELHVCLSSCLYSSVQAAVDAASSGGLIKVAAGTYTGVSARQGVTQAIYISKTITLQGGYTTTNWTISDPDANPTVLDAQGKGRVLYVIGDISPTIEGLYITGGNAAGLGGGYFGFDCGGGVYLNHRDVSSAATLMDNRVFSNTAVIGGGVCLHYGTPTLKGNVVSSNTAGNGGGLWLYQTDATLRGNTISSNTAGDGGGGLFLLHVLFALGHDTLEGNAIISNTSSNMGGGLFFQSGAATLRGNVIRGNIDSGTGYWWNGGGGLYMCCGSTPVLINNVIADNRALSGSGGLMIRESSPLLFHTTIARNSGSDGSGVYIFSMGGGSRTVALTNTILVSHSVGISVTGGNTVTVNSVLWHNAPITVSQSITAIVTVQNQRMGDPAFAFDGYHITATSAAVNAAVNAGVTMDFDNQPRPYQTPDIGADEYWPPGTPKYVYLPVVLKQSP